MAMRRRYDTIEDTFGPKGWKQDIEIFYRQRRSVFFVLALMIATAAFWTNVWVWTIFFAVMAVYSVLVGVRMGFLTGISFSVWFLALNKGWVHQATWENQVVGLWCLSTLFLLVVWKKDGAERIKLHRPEIE